MCTEEQAEEDCRSTPILNSAALERDSPGESGLFQRPESLQDCLVFVRLKKI